MESGGRKEAEVSSMIVVQVRDDNVADARRVYANSPQRIVRPPQECSAAAFASVPVETRIDNDGFFTELDRPDEIIEWHVHVVNVRRDKILAGRSIRMGPVAKGIHFVVWHGRHRS